LNDIPADSPKRGEAEIKTGQAMWSEYLQGMQAMRKWESGEEAKPEGVDLAAKKATLEQIKARAQKTLEDGVARMKATGKVDESAATASLSLAQIYVDTGQADKAVTVLEDAQLGPLTLVKAGSPATQRQGFAGETYKSTLRAYISSLAGAADADATVKKATEVMAAMKEAIPPDQLIVIYVSLARDLEQQMKLAAPEAKKALSKGFETFLKQIRSATTEFSVLNWVAETFSGIAAGFDTTVQGKPVLTAEAKKYYEEALATYQTILDKVKFDDPKLKTQILLRQANAYRHLFQFSKARDIYRDVLKASNTMLNIQVESAKLYQEWAALAKDEDKSQLYLRAMAGSEKDATTGKNIIWGWGRLFQTAAKYPNFRDVFHEARYNLALCRFNMSRVQKTKTDQQEQLKKAKDAITQTQQLFGSGPEWEAWKPRYDALMKEIQKALGEKPLGLPQLQPPAGAAAGKETKEAAGKPAASPAPPPLKPPAGPPPPAAKKAA
jgi:tetratricopeptide (TPR) repeat protein